MINREDDLNEKTIKGLEYEINSAIYYRYSFKDCVSVSLLRDALSLLKAQEPRVMTICEIQSFDGAVYIDEPRKPMCLKMLYCCEVGQRTYGHGYTFIDSDGNRVFYSDQGFGTRWRCWTKRPTKEQREAVKWDE